jgi:hypothetical protein
VRGVRVLRLLPASLLLVEALSTGLRLASLVSTLVVYGPVALGMLALRGLVGAAQFTGGWLLLSERPTAAPIARMALLASAALTTLEIGFRLAPTNQDPSLRWYLVAVYWAYTLAMTWFLGRLEKR